MGTVLVTGGAGSVGKRVVKRLCQAGCTVRVFDLPGMDYAGLEGEEGIEVLRGDITQLTSVQQAVEGVSAVVHLAALLPPASERRRDLTFAINVEGTARVAEMLKRDRSVVPLFASEASVEAALKDLPDITNVLESHSPSRGLVCDMAATVLTLVMGWMLFGDHSLGIAGIGDQIARKAARDRAASHFLLGAGLGSAFYSVFPPKPSVWQVVWATLCVGLFVTCMSLLAGMFSDPWLKRTGLQQAQLHRLIDAMEDRLHLHVRKRIKPVLKQMAA